MYRTGGGTSNAPDFDDDVEEKVMSICSNITGLEARHDSDTFIPTAPPATEVCVEPLTITIMDADQINQMDCVDTENIENLNISQGQATVNIPDLDESFILEVTEDAKKTQKENKWKKWHPKTLKTRVSNVLRADTANKASVTNKLDKLSTARLALVELQMETSRKQLQFMEEEHKLKLIHLENDEKRKQEIHELLLKKIKLWTYHEQHDIVPYIIEIV